MYSFNTSPKNSLCKLGQIGFGKFQFKAYLVLLLNKLQKASYKICKQTNLFQLVHVYNTSHIFRPGRLFLLVLGLLYTWYNCFKQVGGQFLTYLFKYPNINLNLQLKTEKTVWFNKNCETHYRGEEFLHYLYHLILCNI